MIDNEKIKIIKRIPRKKQEIAKKMYNISFKGKGSFGCVVHPAIPCDEDDIKTRHNHVSKIFYEDDDADDELFRNEIIKDFDEEQQYSLKPIKLCSVNTSSLPLKIHEECDFEIDTTSSNKVLRQSSKVRKQILYEDAGIDLRRVFDVHPQIMYEDILIYFENLFNGVIKLNDKNLIHLDIKPRNIVFNIKNKGRELRLIDFGLVHEKKIAQASLKARHGTFWDRVKKKYEYYPFDFLVFDTLLDKSVSKDERLSRFMIHLNQRTLAGLHHRHSLQYNMYRNFINTNFYNFIVPLINNSVQKNIQKYIDFMPDKIDVYSLGASLLEMYFFASKSKKFRDAEWCEKNVLPVIFKIIHPSIDSRLSSKDALKEWKTLIRKLRKGTRS